MAALVVNVSLLEVDLTGNLIGMAAASKVGQMTHRSVHSIGRTVFV